MYLIELIWPLGMNQLVNALVSRLDTILISTAMLRMGSYRIVDWASSCVWVLIWGLFIGRLWTSSNPRPSLRAQRPPAPRAAVAAALVVVGPWVLVTLFPEGAPRGLPFVPLIAVMSLAGAPLVEEFAFRGLVYHRLTIVHGVGPWAAGAIASLSWTLTHMPAWSRLDVFLVLLTAGVGLAALRRSAGLPWCVVAHSAANGLLALTGPGHG